MAATITLATSMTRIIVVILTKAFTYNAKAAPSNMIGVYALR
jgi:hypothetical protein